MTPLPDLLYLRECFDCDPPRGILLWLTRPRSHFQGNPTVSRRWNTRYAGKAAARQVAINGILYLTHRVLWKMATGDEPPEIDHINGDRTDNRIENLRAVSHEQNMRNLRRRKPRTLPRGVSPWKGRWRASITVNYVHHHLGIFDSVAAAEAAYLSASSRLHGDFGRAAQCAGN